VKELTYRNIYDFPEEEKRVLIRNEDDVFGIYKFLKDKKVYSKCGEEKEIKPNKFLNNCFWTYFDMNEEEIEEILKDQRLLKYDAEKFLRRSVRAFVDKNPLLQEKFEYPTMCFLFGKTGDVKERITIDNICEFLAELSIKKILGHFFSNELTLNKNDIEYYMGLILSSFLDDDPIESITEVFDELKSFFNEN
jgi:hypothetical protein